MSQHRRIHSGIKPYVCRYCDRKFTQLSHVQQHERIHTGEKPYKCEELDVHVQAKHSGNRYAKVLVCPACSKSYNSETYLAKHMERHKEAVTNANVNRFGALNTSAGALGALSGFMSSHHSGMGSRSIAPVTEQSLHEELQQRIGHPQDLQNLQRAAVAAAASIMSPMGPPGLGGHDTNHLLHHLPSGLQGQLSMAQKSHQQGIHSSGNHPGGHNTPGFVDSYQQHQMLAAASPYSNQMPSFLGRSSDVRQMPRFPPTPLDATGRKMMDFQGNQPMPPQQQALNPPLAHQQMSLEHSAPPQTPSMQPPPPPPQFQSPQTLPHQQSQSMRPFVNSPQDARRGKSMEGGNGKHVGDDGKEVNSWDQGPVIPMPIMDSQDNGSSVSLTGDESGGNLWTPHSAAKRLKPDPDERYSHHHPHHQTQQQPFETEYLRRSAAAEPQYQQQMIQSHMQASENSMEHVVDKLAKFWQRNSTGQTMDGKPGRDIRIEALLSGFPQNSERDRRPEEIEQDNESGEMERLCNMSQSSSTTNRERDYQPEVQSPRPSREENESGYRGNSEEDRENNGARNDGTATPGYHHTAYGSSVANEGRNNSETGYSNTGTFYPTDTTARDLSVIREDDGVQQQADSTGNGVGFPVHFSSQSAQ
ncbi:unnamed protein product [Rodentolepis nana]|uniref:C2H2-type domain-containing protein n=1 Tax=Rodentolepis nana TaxID=102285 RepID=A0A3P7TBN3_RODNA|nr:unnamed protein product [Rodentolepis nana]